MMCYYLNVQFQGQWDKTGVPQCTQTWIRDEAIPKTMEAKNSQNTRLTKRKGSCRISTVRWAWLLGYTSSPHRNPSWPLLHVMQPPRTHGQKPLGQCTELLNRTDCERYWEGRAKMVGNWLCSFYVTFLCDYCLSSGLLYLFWLCSFLAYRV